MAYTLGTLHDLLGGSGSISVSQPLGLLLDVFTVPMQIGVQPGTPLILHRLGHITPADPNGWYERIIISHAKQLCLPIPEGCTLVGYDLALGVGLSIRELVGGQMPKADPWDRSPVSVSLFAAPQAAPGGFVTMWTYTVPTGRKLHVSSADLAVARITAATTPSVCSVYVFANGVGFHSLHAWSNAPGDRQMAPLAPDGMTFEAGTVISAGYQDFSAGGSRQISAELQGYTFLA